MKLKYTSVKVWDKSEDDPNGWLAAAGASCQQLMPLGCSEDLHNVDPAHSPVGSFIGSADFCPASCGTCGAGSGGHRRAQRTDNMLRIQVATRAPTPGQAREAIDELLSDFGGTPADVVSIPARGRRMGVVESTFDSS